MIKSEQQYQQKLSKQYSFGYVFSEKNLAADFWDPLLSKQFFQREEMASMMMKMMMPSVPTVPKVQTT